MINYCSKMRENNTTAVRPVFHTDHYSSN